MSEYSNVLLPDGSLFPFWDDRTCYGTVLHVDNQAPNASDANDGSEASPFLTINRAAQALLPGQKAVIHTGVYRECVTPRRGGTDDAHMIAYEAAPGARVIITGTERWNGPFSVSREWRSRGILGGAGIKANLVSEHASYAEHAAVFCGELPEASFVGSNPFQMPTIENLNFRSASLPMTVLQYMPEDASRYDFFKRRGLLFCDGARLRQVLFPEELYFEGGEGTYWVDDRGLEVLFRLPDDGAPEGHTLEYTARQQCIQPAANHLNYIRISGLVAEKGGNGSPGAQRGLISARKGHHWIVEDCAVRDANGLGIDVGLTSGFYAISPEEFDRHGYTILRRNVISRCGIGGIAAFPAGSHLLVEDNVLESNCWHNMTYDYESAAIKTHRNEGCLYRRNRITDTRFGSGIWLDSRIHNTLVRDNVILDTREAMFGAFFLEASGLPNLVVNNIIVGCGKYRSSPGVLMGGHGIYEHDCDLVTVRRNLILGCQGAGVMMNLGEVERPVVSWDPSWNPDNATPHGALGRGISVVDNLISDCGSAVCFPTEHNFADGNVYGAFRTPFVFEIQNPKQYHNFFTWQSFLSWDGNGRWGAEIRYTPDPEALMLSLEVDGRRFSVNLRGGFPVASLLPGTTEEKS